MDPNNNQPADNPAMPQPLNTSGPPMPDTTGVVPPSAGLPPQLPGNPEITQSSGGGKKMMTIIIIILVLAILGVGGYYFYTQYAQKTTQPVPQTVQPDQDLINLQTEADGIEVTDPSGDLVEVDSEINLLEATPSTGGR